MKQRFFSRETTRLLFLSALVVVAFLFIVLGAKSPMLPLGLQHVSFEGQSSHDTQKAVADIIARGDVAGCAAVDTVTSDGVHMGTVCRNNINQALAIQKLDPSFCDRLDDQLQSVNLCKREVIGDRLKAKGGSLSACDGLTPAWVQLLCQETYWREQALQKNDPELCKKMKDAALQNECRTALATNRLVAEGGKTNCTAYPSGLVNDCVKIKQAIQRKAVQSCSTLSYALWQPLCVRLVSQTTTSSTQQTP